MVDQNYIQKLKKDYPDFFEQIPSEIINLITSKETSYNIAKICLENRIKDEKKIEKIAYQITLVLLKQYPKEKLPKIFEKNIGLIPEIANKIYDKLNKSIFFQAKKLQAMPKVALGLE